MSAVREALSCLFAGRSLAEDQTHAALNEIFEGSAPASQVAGFLVALRLKGESGHELAGAARAMLRHAVPLDLGSATLLDTAGTGGDGAGTFNISTGAALVAAAAGAKVAKHGNRAASATVGAADVLEQLGVKIDLDSGGLRRCLERAGICFVFAQKYHPVMATVAALRRELGFSTIFNLLGPLANPARPQRQLVGVWELRRLEPMAEALAALGAQHALLVHSCDGVDEISLAGPTTVIEVRAGRVMETFAVSPEDFGIRRQDRKAIAVASPGQAPEMLQHALAGQASAAQDVLALNGGAAIYLAGLCPSLDDAVARAFAVLREGLALETLAKLRRASQEPSL